MYVRFVASLGANFVYRNLEVDGDDPGIFDLLFEKLKSAIGNYADLKTLTRDQTEFNEKMANDDLWDESDSATRAQEFISLQMEHTKMFLSRNVDVKVFSADKGGRVVITDTRIYHAKMIDHLKCNVAKGIYRELKGFDFEYIRHVCESKYERVRNEVNVWLEKDSRIFLENTRTCLNREPFIISRIYGLLKIHKTGYPIRPIVSATGCMAQPLSKWMLGKLNLIAVHIGKYQVHSSHELFKMINGKMLFSSKHILATWDFDNMFTNIPFQRTKEIIAKYYHLIQRMTSMPLETFLEALTFLVEETAFFTYGDTIYLQTEGLAMGNSLSQILAEITTSHFLNEALLPFDDGRISFVHKYVDDIITCADVGFLNVIQKQIETLHGMKLKLTMEDNANEVNYLDLKVGRCLDDGSICVRWIQKDYSSKRIIDFHSYHPLKMKINVVKQYVKNALNLTSFKYRNVTINALRKTLRNSNYRNSFINRHMNQARREISQQRIHKVAKPSKRYVVCPYRPGIVNYFRRTLNRTGLKDVSIAPLIRRNNNRNVIFANLKDRRGLNNTKNSSFSIECMNCEFKSRIFAKHYDVERTFLMTIDDANSEIRKHCETRRHSISMKINPRNVTRYQNEFDCKIAKRCNF